MSIGNGHSLFCECEDCLKDFYDEVEERAMIKQNHTGDVAQAPREPGLGWTLSEEAAKQIAEIYRNIREAPANIARIAAQPPAAPVETGCTSSDGGGESRPASTEPQASASRRPQGLIGEAGVAPSPSDPQCSAEISDARPRAPDLADWSSLPRDLYVVSVKSSDKIVYDVHCCSVPMAIGPEVRYSAVQDTKSRDYERGYAGGWYDMMAKAADVAAAMGHEDVDLKIRSIDRPSIELEIQPRGGMTFDWQEQSLIYQKRLRALMRLINKKGYAVASDGAGMPYRLETSASRSPQEPSHLPAEPQQAREWRSVETAPRDVEVLMCWEAEWPERRWEYACGLWGSTRGGWIHGQATHWMPLPSSPMTRPKHQTGEA